MPTARESVSACVIDGKIYAIGGFPGGGDRGITTVERYDPVTNNWTEVAPMDVGRRMPVTVTVDDKCYAIGGRTTDGQTPLDAVERYDPSTNSWTTLTPMPTARFAHAGAQVGGIIYVIGGTNGQSISRVVEAYNPATDTWTTLSPTPIARGLATATALNGKIYVMGGSIDGVNQRYALLEIYDPVTDTWSTGSNMPYAAFSLQSQAANGRIYAFGGTTGFGALNDAAEYDPSSDNWESIQSMSGFRTRFASAVVDDLIYAIGGTVSWGNPHVGVDSAERYTPRAADEPQFPINAGISDAWFNPATPGQGFLISVFPDLQQVFVAWFTYDITRPAPEVEAILGDPGHRWITAQGPYDGDTASLTVFETVGGVFDAAQPVPTTDPQGDGSLTIEFADCENGLVNYSIASTGSTGTVPIQRISLDNVSLCETLAGQQSQ